MLDLDAPTNELYNTALRLRAADPQRAAIVL
jgi:hypothetical protein